MVNANQSQREVLFSGNEALAQGAYEAGVHFAAAYPGTPSSEILEFLAQFPEVDSQWSVNEKVAFEVALAAAIGGKRSLYASKHVGINVAMDPLMTSAYVGVNAGFVIVSCDDPGMHSSQNEQDNRLIARAANVPCLEPSSPAEAKEFVKLAFDLSERYDIPVMVRLTTRVCHSKENVHVGSRRDYPVKAFETDTAKYVMVPGNARKRHEDLIQRIKRLSSFSERTKCNSAEIRNRDLGFITSGISYLYVKEKYPDASVCKIGMPYPFPQSRVGEFCRKVKRVCVVEELEPFLEEQVRLLGVKCQAKHPSFRLGELRPEDIPLIVAGKPRAKTTTTSRPPSLCQGCPHRLVFNMLREAGAVVAGDIGCYTLGALPPFTSLHTCLCMGTGVTFFEGLSRSVKGKKVVGVIGDSTFVHSGITGLINAAYNKVKGLIIILDNSTTAMTGGQPHPATGVTIKNEPTKKLVLEDICRASGADIVDVIDPVRMNEFKDLLMRRLHEEQLSVIIVRKPCILYLKKMRAV
jgi:indolepyruvate ferredoxin oxidoreductase, alpha subunit